MPFDDASGDRLGEWLGVDRATFYDPQAVAILPMGFCHPGTGKGGDLPPRPECADAWRQPLLALLRDLRWTFVIGRYAIDRHLDADGADALSTVRAFDEHRARSAAALPHPNLRNNLWLRRTPRLERDALSVRG